MDSAQHIVKLRPTAVELVDRTMIDLSRQNPVFRPTIERALVKVGGAWPQAILLVEFAGENRAELLHKLQQLLELVSDLGLPDAVVQMPDETDQKALWEVRKAGLNIMMSLKGDGKPVSFIEDCAVPLEHLAEYTARLTEVFSRHGSRGTWYAHASVGTLHVRPILDMRREGAVKMRQIAEEAAVLVRQYKGAFSGEHGDGLVRSEWVGWQFGERLTRAFEEVKDAFDPIGLMNPGKIVRASKMDDRSLFRFKPDYAPRPLASGLDWSAWNVQNDPNDRGDQCVREPGEIPPAASPRHSRCATTMAIAESLMPARCARAFRVTRDEQHLTRGRANTLRLALSGQLALDEPGNSPNDALASQALYDTMDLCVGCKGCKRECPTGVDMARMKTEFLFQYHQTHSLKFSERMVVNLPRHARWMSRLAPLVNLGSTLPGVSTLVRTILGFAPLRSLPVWRRKSFLNSQPVRVGWRPLAKNPASRKSLCCGPIPSTTTSSPRCLHAALKVLEAAGYSVHLPQIHAAAQGEPLCCGRTALAYGQIPLAREHAQRTLDALMPFVRRGVAVVGLEPSCLLSLRDEYLVLKLGADAQLLADNAFLFEEFLLRERTAGRLALKLKPLSAKRALVHGHCHQKAFDAFKPVVQVLGWIPGLEVKPIESSCCGMAGAFGYSKHHWDISMKMAEAALLPAIRSANADDLIVADGVSCRHQVLDGAARPAQHVATVLASALE